MNNKRELEKILTRKADQELLESGRMTAKEINERNSFFGSFSPEDFKIISIRGKNVIND